MASFPNSIKSFVTHVINDDILPAYLNDVQDEIVAVETALGAGGLGYLGGWIPVSGTWTYASASTITIPTDGTTVYSVGDRIRLKQGGAYKYFVIGVIAATLITVCVNTDYVVAVGAITDVAFSKSNTPVGYPTWFNAAYPSMDVTYLDNGSSGQPTAGKFRYRVDGNTVTVNIDGSGVKAGANNIVMRFADTYLPPINETNMPSYHAAGTAVTYGAALYTGAMVHRAYDHYYYSIMADNVADNDTIYAFSAIFQYEM
jgi:hypothetical protein